MTLKTDLEICFVEHILDTMANLVPLGFLCIWKFQYMIGSFYSFSVILKPRRLVYSVFFFYYLVTTFISFAVSFISISSSAYLIQYHFNIVSFTYNKYILGYSINRDTNKFSEWFKRAYDVIF